MHGGVKLGVVAAIVFVLSGLSLGARADCGGGGGDGGGGGGGSDGRDADDCVEVSDIVGYSRCRRFGREWNGSGGFPYRLSAGPSVRRLSVEGLSFGGSVEHHDRQFQLGREGSSLDATDLFAGGLTLRFDFTVADYVIFGLESSVALTSVSGPGSFDAGVLQRPDQLMAFEGGAIAGVQLPIGPLTLGFEVLLGARALMLGVSSVLEDCDERAALWAGVGVVEPRLTARYFVGPTLSLGAFVGTNVVVPGEVQGGLMLSLHSRGLDGHPSR